MIAFVFAVVLASAPPTPAAALGPATPAALAPEAGGRLRTLPGVAGAAPAAAPADAAVLTNGGSTNTAPYQIVVRPDGAVTATIGASTREGRATKAVTAKLFADLGAARPLASLATRGCMKSASFGSTTTLGWQGTTTGDLGCGGDERARTLLDDLRAVEASSGIDTSFGALSRSRTRRYLMVAPVATPFAAPSRATP